MWPVLRDNMDICDIEINPGPVINYSQGFKICHWNLNSLPTDNFIKIPHLEAYAISHNIDIICLSETFLNTSYSNNDTRLHLHGRRARRTTRRK